MTERERFQKEARFPQRRRTPSFSSSLLDSIYDSLDESNANYFHQDRRNHFREPTIPVKHRGSGIDSFRGEEKETENFNRDVMGNRHLSVLYYSRSSSSDSSTGAAFSSSETELSYRGKSKLRSTGNGVSGYKDSEKDQNLKHRDGGLEEAKLEAPKFYGELKKVKQPISPGRRITNFLTSIFNSGNVKKAKMCYAGAVEDVSISPATSFSRSCLNNPSSRGKSSSGNKKRVKFYPISAIVDEDPKPSSLKYPTIEKKRQFLKRFLEEEDEEEEEEEEEEGDDDCSSCSSSDLFEINHVVGIGRYQEELPVYETTNFRTNQAIANGFLL